MNKIFSIWKILSIKLQFQFINDILNSVKLWIIMYLNYIFVVFFYWNDIRLNKRKFFVSLNKWKFDFVSIFYGVKNAIFLGRTFRDVGWPKALSIFYAKRATSHSSRNTRHLSDFKSQMFQGMIAPSLARCFSTSSRWKTCNATSRWRIIARRSWHLSL